MRALVIALCVIGLGGTAGIADAAPDPQAAAHYRQGKAFLDAKQYDQAIVEFEAAYAIDKVASHLNNIAKAYEAKQDYDKAIEYYQKYLLAEPNLPAPRKTDIRGTIAALTKVRDEAVARKKADEEAARLAAEKKRLEAEQANKAVLATGHVKQAEAYAHAGAWVDAGNEHRAAFAIDGDAAHLLAAAEAFRKAPDLEKTREAYAAYLEKVPVGGESDAVRAKLAETTRAIEKAAEDERVRKAKEAQEQAERDRRERDRTRGSTKEPHRSFKRGWIVVGGAMLLTGLIADLKAPNGDNGVFDASDLAGPVLYGLGTLAVLRGVF